MSNQGLLRTRGDTALLTQVTGNESFAPSHRGYNPAPHSGEYPWSRCEELLSRAHFTPAGVCLSAHRGFVGPDLADGAAHAECTSWTTIPLGVTTYPAHVGIYSKYQGIVVKVPRSCRPDYDSLILRVYPRTCGSSSVTRVLAFTKPRARGRY